MDNSQEMPKELSQIARELELAEAKKIALGWRGIFDGRRQRLIKNCCTYTDNDPAGLPGHQLMLIVAEMASLLDGRD